MHAYGDGTQHGKPTAMEGRDLQPDAREGQAGSSYDRAEAVIVFDSPKRKAKGLLKAAKKAGFSARVKPEEAGTGSRSSSS